MINIQLVKIFGAIVQRDNCFIQFCKFISAETHVVVLKKIVTCLFKLWTWLASIKANTVELTVVAYFLITSRF